MFLPFNERSHVADALKKRNVGKASEEELDC